MEHRGLLKISRIEGLTDSVFAIAMTILMFELHLPSEVVSAHLTPNFFLSGILEKIFIFAGSFIILGTQWIGSNFHHGFIERINRHYLWANIFFLMTACIVPFSASLLVDYPRSPISISFYAINLLCMSLGQMLMLQCARIYHLNTSNFSATARSAVLQRILMPPLFYCAALILAHWNTTIAFITLIIPPLFHIAPGKIDRYNKDE